MTLAGRRERRPTIVRCKRSTPTVTSCRCRPGIAFHAANTGYCASESRDSPTSSPARPRRQATRELTLVHDATTCVRSATATLGAAEQRAIGFPWSEEMVERSRRSVGRDDRGRPRRSRRWRRRQPRRRHPPRRRRHAAAATASSTMSRSPPAVLQAEAALRVVVVDLDVHQGDGTAAIFAGDASVFTISLHGAKNFPFRKATSDLDVALRRRLRRRRLPRRARRRARAAGARARGATVRSRVLSRRRRSARGRPARPAEGQRRRAAPARSPRPRRSRRSSAFRSR